jgi:hypothetical protein
VEYCDTCPCLINGSGVLRRVPAGNGFEPYMSRVNLVSVN